MNDDFLKDYKKRPRSEFARSLHKKLSQQGETRMNPISPLLRYVLATLLIALISVAAVPAVRAQVGKALEPMVTFVFTSEPVPPSTTPGLAAPISGEDATEDTMALASAQAQLGFKTLLPTWLPQGFVLSVISHNRCEYISPNLCENPAGRELQQTDPGDDCAAPTGD